MTTPPEQPSQELVAIDQILKDRKSKIAAVLPSHIDVDKFLHVTMDLVSQDSKLSRCTALSIFQSVIEASQLGVMLGKHLGHGYLVPFQNGQLSKKHGRDIYDCQFMMGYRGYIHLIKKADSDIQTVFADLVFTDEGVELDQRDRSLLHAPKLTRGHVKVDPQSGETSGYVGAYCKIIYKNGMQDYEWMSRDEIEKVRKAGKAAGDRSPWKTWADPMIKKCPIRQIAKRLDLRDVTEAAVRDEYRDLGMDEAKDITPPQTYMEPQRKSEQPAAVQESATATEDETTLREGRSYTGPVLMYQISTSENRPHKLRMLTQHCGELEVSFFSRGDELRDLESKDVVNRRVTITYTENKGYKNLATFAWAEEPNKEPEKQAQYDPKTREFVLAVKNLDAEVQVEKLLEDFGYRGVEFVPVTDRDQFLVFAQDMKNRAAAVSKAKA